MNRTDPPPERLPAPPPPVVGVQSPPPAVPEDTGDAEGPCPNCGAAMNAIRGSKQAICANCGFKDSCCF
jgi:hypothetical protein